MKKKISHFAVHKTSLTVAVLYTILMIPFIMIMMVIGLGTRIKYDGRYNASNIYTNLWCADIFNDGVIVLDL